MDFEGSSSSPTGWAQISGILHALPGAQLEAISIFVYVPFYERRYFEGMDVLDPLLEEDKFPRMKTVLLCIHNRAWTEETPPEESLALEEAQELASSKLPRLLSRPTFELSLHKHFASAPPPPFAVSSDAHPAFASSASE